MIQGWYWKEKLDAVHSQGLKGQRRAAKVIRRKKKEQSGDSSKHIQYIYFSMYERTSEVWIQRFAISTLRVQSAFSLSMNAMMNTSSFT